MRFEIVKGIKSGNMNNSFNIPKFYSELKIKTAENSEFYLKSKSISSTWKFDNCLAYATKKPCKRNAYRVLIC